MPFERIHLLQDRTFFYLDRIYSDKSYEKLKIALAFQRDIINNIVPKVRPDHEAGRGNLQARGHGKPVYRAL